MCREWDETISCECLGAHRQSIGAQGGIDAIATAMKDFPVDEPLQDAACGALWVLAFHRKCSRHPA